MEPEKEEDLMVVAALSAEEEAEVSPSKFERRLGRQYPAQDDALAARATQSASELVSGERGTNYTTYYYVFHFFCSFECLVAEVLLLWVIFL